MNLYIVTQFQYIKNIEKVLKNLEALNKFEFLILDKQLKENKTKRYKFFSTGIDIENYISNKFSSSTDHLLNFNIMHIYSNEFIKKLNNRIYNFHNSLLPKYKGINSVNWGLYNREKEWGITWHEIDSKIDSGKIIYQKKFKIPENIYQIDLHDYSLILGIKSILELLSRIKSSDYLIIPQEKINDHIFYSYEKPYIYIENIEELNLIERSQPFTSIEKFRWNIKLKDINCTLISTNSNFKNRLKLNKSIIIFNRRIFYAD